LNIIYAPRLVLVLRLGQPRSEKNRKLRRSPIFRQLDKIPQQLQAGPLPFLRVKLRGINF
jgi:hypothetical protein